MNWHMIVSGLLGAVMLALGCGIIVPFGSVVGGLFDLGAIASAMFFVGMMDGQ